MFVQQKSIGLYHALSHTCSSCKDSEHGTIMQQAGQIFSSQSAPRKADHAAVKAGSTEVSQEICGSAWSVQYSPLKPAQQSKDAAVS